MQLLALTLLGLITAGAATGVGPGEPAGNPDAIASELTLVGQLALPEGSGSRGVEVVATITEAEGDPYDQWIVFDENGQFSSTSRGNLTRLIVSTGLRAELQRLEAEDLPAADSAGQIDLGVIDLRDQLTRHRLVLRVAEGAQQGDVRVAMFFGPPPVGPQGEPVSLGSRQFPPVALGSEMEWLLPLEVESLYFLVEWPVGSALEPEWQGGPQRLFGPFSSADLPTELNLN